MNKIIEKYKEFCEKRNIYFQIDDKIKFLLNIIDLKINMLINLWHGGMIHTVST